VSVGTAKVAGIGEGWIAATVAATAVCSFSSSFNPVSPKENPQAMTKAIIKIPETKIIEFFFILSSF
jgi:hypothetical protein